MKHLYLPLVGLISFSSLAAAEPSQGTFTFGSYGRVGLSTDESLARPQKRQITSSGPRIIQNDYLELDLNIGWSPKDIGEVAVKTTVAYLDALPHATADFDSRVAVRQAFLLVDKVLGTGAFVWFGSRMARGDDIYLLDTWVLDDLNIVGLGSGYRWDKREASLVFGLNQQANAYQIQRIPRRTWALVRPSPPISTANEPSSRPSLNSGSVVTMAHSVSKLDSTGSCTTYHRANAASRWWMPQSPFLMIAAISWVCNSACGISPATATSILAPIRKWSRGLMNYSNPTASIAIGVPTVPMKFAPQYRATMKPPALA